MNISDSQKKQLAKSAVSAEKIARKYAGQELGDTARKVVNEVKSILNGKSVSEKQFAIINEIAGKFETKEKQKSKQLERENEISM